VKKDFCLNFEIAKTQTNEIRVVGYEILIGVARSCLEIKFGHFVVYKSGYVGP